MPGPTADVRVETPVMDTEDPAKVERAVRNLFPDAECAVEDDRLVAQATDLSRLRDLIEDQQIQPTARGKMLHGADSGAIRVRLSKQSAYAGAVNFSVGDVALGDLEVEIATDDVDLLVDRVAPAGGPSEPTEGDRDG